MTRSLVAKLLVPIVTCFVFLQADVATSQTESSQADIAAQLADSSGSLPPAAVEALIARLSDEEVRRLLINELESRSTPVDAQSTIDIAGFADDVEDQLALVGERALQLLAAIPKVPSAFSKAMSSLQDGRNWTFWVLLPLGFAAMLGGGVVLEKVFKRLAQNSFAAIEQRAESFGGRLGQIALATALRLVELILFAIGGLAVFFAVWSGHEATRVVIMTFFGAVIVTRLVGIILRVLLSPDHANHRIANFDDHDARILYRHGMIVAAVTTITNSICAAYFVLGDQPDVHYLVLRLASMAIFIAIFVGLLRAKSSLATDLADDGSNIARNHLAKVWPNILLGYSALLFVVFNVLALLGHQISLLAAFGTFLTVLLVPHIDVGLERMAKRLDREGEGGQIRSVILRASRIALLAASLVFVAEIWGIDLFTIAEESAGARLADALIDIALTALIAYILWEVTRIVIDRKINLEAGPVEAEERGGEGGGQGATRLATILPLIKRTIQATIAVMAIMLMLSALGVNIGPLLAGAGVVGLAIGFGAQTLVRDIVSGFFFLMDDAFRVGEYIDVGSVKGTVEKISVRSLRLRHHRGPLNTIPFGEITHLTNFSRDWVIMKLEFRVPFDTDIQKVKRIFKQIGKDLMSNPEIADDFLDPFKSQGVYTVDDSALVIRAKFTAKPGRQFIIRREAYLAVQRAFAENDIRFADRRVTVHVPEAATMTEEQRQKVEQAASSALITDQQKPAAA